MLKGKKVVTLLFISISIILILIYVGHKNIVYVNQDDPIPNTVLSENVISSENSLVGYSPMMKKVIKNNNDNEYSDIVFIDHFNGWKLMYNNASMNTQSATLYITSDSGESWAEINNTEKTIPYDIKTGLIFINKNVGWISTMSSVEGYVGIYKTLDGGVSWNYQEIIVPSEYSGCLFYTYPPIFFNEKDGILITRQNELEQLVYETHDGGKNWLMATDETNDDIGWSFSKFDKSANWDLTYDSETWLSSNGYIWTKTN